MVAVSPERHLLKAKDLADGRYGDGIAVDGAANEMLVKVLSTTFGVPANSITILSGATSRTKLVRLDGVTEADVRRLAP